MLTPPAPTPKARLCVLVPCLNEEESLPHFFDAVLPSLNRCAGGDWSILVVDDGSTDGTFELVSARHAVEPRIGIISLSRNFGHQAAITAGLNFIHAETIAIMDADLQDPPEVMEKLFAKVVNDGFDLCLGVRGKREAPWLLNAAYKLFYRLMKSLSDHPWPVD
ncbi:MAG: glycosyltransferase family 2 protein, partial [Verrucomicrobiaceae bacterium]|nr:glycosyltransferase family 2 protein [Verrucomicrobiaceae bacterium]